MSEDKTGRLLNLVATLRDSATPLTADDLRQRVREYGDYANEASFRRTFERDKDELRRIGVELEVVMTEHLDPPVAAYRIPRDRFELPDPGLTPDELAALHVAATAVRLEGISEDEVTDAFRKLGRADAPTGGRLGAVGVPEHLPALFAAALEHREVAFDYAGSPRRLRPHRLQYERGRWYVSGHDLDREDRRSFRVDRITGAVTAGPPGAFEPPEHPGGVGLRPWEYGEGEAVEAVVLVDHVVAGPVLAEDPDLDPGPAGRDDDGVRLRLRVTDPDGLVGFVLSLGDRAELLDPPELRARLVAHLEALAVADDAGAAA
jgi:proteasome accessory factor B